MIFDRGLPDRGPVSPSVPLRRYLLRTAGAGPLYPPEAVKRKDTG